MGKYKISGNEGNRESTRKALKRIFQLPFSTTYTGIIMETGIWPAKQKIQYATMMLYHNIKNSDDNRKVKQVVEEQEQNQFKNTFYQKVQKIAKDLQIDISDVTSTSKSNCKKKVKGKAIDRIRKRMKEDMQEKTKCRTVRNDKWERKQYIKKCESNTIKDVIKIRIHMWNTKCNYKRNELDTTCPLCKTEEDTTEHIMACEEGNNTYNLLDENEKDWEKIVAIYKNNKKVQKEKIYNRRLK